MKSLLGCYGKKSRGASRPSSSSETDSAPAPDPTPPPAASSSSGPSASRSEPSPTLKQVICQYKLNCTSEKQLWVTFTWSCKHNSKGYHRVFLLISVGDDIDNVQTNKRLLQAKGKEFFLSCHSLIEVAWDLSSTRYNDSAQLEPSSGFFVVLLVDSELALFLGDMAEEASQQYYGNQLPSGKSGSLFSRTEQFATNCMSTISYSTKAQFVEGGAVHDIRVDCRAEEDAPMEPVLGIWIDGNQVLQVTKLRWRFRGNHTLSLGHGFVVDIMWDMHDWLSCGTFGVAVFMFVVKSKATVLNQMLLRENKPYPYQFDEAEFCFILRCSRCFS